MINRNEIFYRIKNKKTRKYVKEYGFLPFAKNISKKYGKKLIDTTTKTGLEAAKTAFKKIFKKVQVTGELIKNKVTDKIV